uniref:Glycosyltransferase n=1 Tax=Prevotella sp. GTC17262 TaxID=3236797 RepID=A0AB33JPR4_9BACT
MRILQVITSLLIGGAEHLVVQLVEKLRVQGIETDVCLFYGERTAFYDELEATGCKIYCLSDKENYYDVRHIVRLRRIMRSYDIVHTHNSAPQIFVALANIGLSKILVTTEHNTDNRKRRNRLFSLVDRWMYSKYKRIICISDQAEANLRQYLYGVTNSTCEIETIYNGIAVGRFQGAFPLDYDKRGKFVVVMVAGFRPQKDQSTLVRAISRLPKDEYELWLVGDGVECQKIELLAKEQNVRDIVKFWGVRSNVPEILHTADVVCMSSHYEGLSLSNIEGMAVGKPFVASDVDGLREVTKDYGILFPHGDAEALANVICKLHDNPDYYHQIAEKCYQRALQFDIANTVEGYKQVYVGLMKDK